MAKHDKKEPEFTSEMPTAEAVGFDLSDARTGPEKELSRTRIQAGKVIFDPYAGTTSEKTIDDQIDRVASDFEKGAITEDQAIAAMEKIYTVNHSVGHNVLYDKRLKPKNRIMRYTAWAVAGGQNPAEARKYAVSVLLGQPDIAGKWGKIERDIDIREV